MSIPSFVVQIPGRTEWIKSESRTDSFGRNHIPRTFSIVKKSATNTLVKCL